MVIKSQLRDVLFHARCHDLENKSKTRYRNRVRSICGCNVRTSIKTIGQTQNPSSTSECFSKYSETRLSIMIPDSINTAKPIWPRRTVIAAASRFFFGAETESGAGALRSQLALLIHISSYSNTALLVWSRAHSMYSKWGKF